MTRRPKKSLFHGNFVEIIMTFLYFFSLESAEAKASLTEVLKSLQLSETKLKSVESDLSQKNSEVETLRSQLQNRPTQNAEAACQTASSAAETSRSSPSSKSTAMFDQQVRLPLHIIVISRNLQN